MSTPQPTSGRLRRGLPGSARLATSGEEPPLRIRGGEGDGPVVRLDGLDRTGAKVVTNAAGDPVSAQLVYTGTARGSKARLTIDIAFKDVAGSFEIQSPKDGAPVVD